MSDRIPCCVPFCRRTAPAAKFRPGEEIICGKCWKRIPAKIKARRSVLRRREKRINRLLTRRQFSHRPGVVTKVDRMEQAYIRLWTRNWEDCKRAAIEARAGIGD